MIEKSVVSCIISFLLAITAVLFIWLAGNTLKAETDVYPVFTSYRDIPGVTEQEIAAIETLRESRAAFIYGMEITTECFVQEDGQMGGFAALFADWMSELFGIRFALTVYEWYDLIGGIDSHTVDFTSDMVQTQERRQIYNMTDTPVAARSIKTMWLAGSKTPAEIALIRPLRYVFVDGVVAYRLVAPFLDETSEVSFVKNTIDAYEVLKSGAADVFVDEAPYEAAFDAYGDILAEEFFPLVYAPVSLTTRNPELTPIISVLQKALDNGANRYLTELYNQGYQQYIRYKFFSHLTKEEQAYINARIESGKPIPIGAEYDNYPICFYNEQENAWQGIALEVLGEIEILTGLRFEIVHDGLVDFPDLMEMLERGEITLLTEVIPTPEREGRFLYPDPYAQDNYALISLLDFKDIKFNEILYLRVGLAKGTAYTELFHEWFPNHTNTVEYDNTLLGLGALEYGEIDLFMGTRKLLLSVTNYLEKPGFKTNIVFNRTYDSNFGVNLRDPQLLSIINRAQWLIDTKTINNRWTTRVFDYRSAAARARTPYLIGASLSLLGVITMLVIMFYRSRRLNVYLEAAVSQRTLELEDQKELAVSASKSKSDFLATMSHEIRTPLGAILGMAQIQMQQDDLPEKYADAFYKIINSGNALLGIINDILDLSKIETGKLELIPSVYDIPNLVNDTMQLNAVRIGSKPIEFILEVDENLPSKLYGDELRLKQILNNLLSNAVKYTEKGHVILSVSVKKYTNDEEIILEFSVSDTGQGMKKEDMERLFTEYQRFNMEANRSTEGTGLGLTITKRLVTMMNGSISVQSEYGTGSVFTVTVPQNVIDSAPIGAQVASNLRGFAYVDNKSKQRQKLLINPMPYGSVLVVDDVESNLLVAKGLLSPYKLKIETADSGFAAIEKVDNGKTYDIIFMDHMMPKMDGIETTQKLREKGYNGVIVALTANALVGNDEKFYESGFDGYISKPIDIQRLDTVLNNFILSKYPEEAKKYKTQTAEVKKPDISAKHLEIFLKEAEKAVCTLRETTSNGDIKLFTTTVHALKTSLNYVGEKDLSERATALETAGRSGDTEFIAANTESFIEALEALAENLRSAEIAAEFSISSRFIEGMDIEKGMQKYNYDERVYINILSVYASNMRIIVNDIKELLPVSKECIDNYRLKVHSIKGTSLDIYANEAGSTASELENAAKAGNIEYINEQTPGFLEKMLYIIGQIDTILCEINEANPKPVRDKPDEKLLSQLKEACDMYSMDGVNKAIDEIEKYRYKADEGLVLWLREMVNIMGFAQIVEKLSDILKEEG